MNPLPESFYTRSDTLLIARELIGKRLVTDKGSERTSGIINETEAYLGIEDKASHAYGGRRTQRTEPMYKMGGISYVYLCYGVHEMFNIVTNINGHPHAILIRSIIPQEGVDTMLRRCNKTSTKGLSNGPGKLSKALDIDRNNNAVSLQHRELHLVEGLIKIPEHEIHTGPRIGIDYAGKDALLPYRFLWDPNM